MSRRPSDRELVSQLVACVESDDAEQELLQLLLEHSARLAPLLGKTPEQLAGVCATAHAPRAARVRSLIELAQRRHRAARTYQSHNLAMAAASHVAGLAQWRDDRVEVDVRIVLGSLLADAAVKFIRFDAEGWPPVVVRRMKLRDAAKALRFDDLTCFLNERGLCFSWRSGRGGLVLVSQLVPAVEATSVLTVAMKPPQARLAESFILPDRAIRPPSFIGDVLGELGFL